MARIEAVTKEKDGRWTWLVDGVAHATNKAGNGIFVEDEYGFYNIQKVGTCDFIACKTVSGMRRKLKSWYNDSEIEDL